MLLWWQRQGEPCLPASPGITLSIYVLFIAYLPWDNVSSMKVGIFFFLYLYLLGQRGAHNACFTFFLFVWPTNVCTGIRRSHCAFTDCPLHGQSSVKNPNRPGRPTEVVQRRHTVWEFSNFIQGDCHSFIHSQISVEYLLRWKWHSANCRVEIII